MAKKFSIPKKVAEQLIKDAEAQKKEYEPIEIELDKLSPGHSKEDAVAAFLRGVEKMIYPPKP